MKVLVACEYSGAVRDAFIGGGMMRGHATYCPPMRQGRTSKATCCKCWPKVGI